MAPFDFIIILIASFFFNIFGYLQIKKYFALIRTKEETFFTNHPWQIYQQDYDIQVNRGKAATKYAWLYLANGIFCLIFGIPLLVLFVLVVLKVI